MLILDGLDKVAGSPEVEYLLHPGQPLAVSRLNLFVPCVVVPVAPSAYAAPAGATRP